MPSMLLWQDQERRREEEEEKKRQPQTTPEPEPLGMLELGGATLDRVLSNLAKGIGGWMQSQGERPRVNLAPVSPEGERLPDYVPGEQAAPWLTEMGEDVSGMAPEERDLSNVPWWQQRVIGGLGSAATFLPGAFMGPVLGPTYLTTLAQGQAYQEGKEQGLDPETNLEQSQLKAGIELGTEYGPLRVLQTGQGKHFFSQLGSFLAKDVPGELVAETGQGIVDYQYDMADADTPADFINSLPEVWKNTVAETLIGGGATIAGMRGAENFVERLTRTPPEDAEATQREGAGTLYSTPVDPVLRALGAPGRAYERFVSGPVTEGLRGIMERRRQRGTLSVAEEAEPQIQEGGVSPRDLLVVRPDDAINLLDPNNRVAGVAAVGFNVDKIDGPEQLKDMMRNVSIINAEEIKQFKQGKWVPQDIRRRMMLEDKVKYDEGIQSWNLNDLMKNQILANPQAVNRILGKPKGSALNAAELAAVVQLNVDSAALPWQLAKEIQRKGDQVTDEDLMKFQLALQKSAWISSALAGYRAEAGRALNILKRMTKLTKDPKEWQEAIEQAEGGGAREWLNDVARKLAQTNDLNHAQQFIRDTRFGQGPIHSIWLANMLSSPITWMTNLASPPLVMMHQAAEDVGGLAVGSARINAARIKALGKMAKGLATGNLQQQMQEAQNLIGRAKAESNTWGDLWEKYRPFSLHGESVASDIMDGLTVLANVGWTGVEIDPVASQLEHGAPMGTKLRTVGGKDIPGTSLFTVPQRVLAATDNMFKTIAYQQQMRQMINQQARQQLQREMESSTQRWTSAQQEMRFQAIKADLTKFKPKELQDKAWQYAREVTMTNPLGPTGKAFMNFRRLRQYDKTTGKWKLSIPGVAMNMALPFLRTPINIAKYMADRGAVIVPAGAVGAAMGAQTRIGDILALRGNYTKADRQKLIGAMAVNGAITYSFIQMAANGLLVGEEPEDPDEREVFRSLYQENSIRNPQTGDHYSLARLDPIGGWATSLATGVQRASKAYREGAIDEGEFTKLMESIFVNGVAGMTRVMSEKTFMQSVDSVLKWFTGESNKPFVPPISAMAVPNILGDAMILIEGESITQKDTRVYGREAERMTYGGRWLKTLLNDIKARTDSANLIPYRKELPDKIDIYGNERLMSSYLTPNQENHVEMINRIKHIANPVRHANIKVDPILADMEQLGFFPEDPATRFKRWEVLPLEGDELKIFKQSRNKAAWEFLNRVRGEGYWEKYNDAQKLFVLKRAFDYGTMVGDMTLFKEKPGLLRVRQGYKLEAKMKAFWGPEWKQRLPVQFVEMVETLKRGNPNSVPWE